LFQPKWYCDITPAKLVFKNGGLLANYPVLSCRFWFLARVRSPPDARGHATPLKSLPGAWWGILNEVIENFQLSCGWAAGPIIMSLPLMLVSRI
jgi:hypothetical protein